MLYAYEGWFGLWHVRVVATNKWIETFRNGIQAQSFSVLYKENDDGAP